MRDHSRNSTMIGSAAASRRKQRGSVRRQEAMTSASRLSSLAPAMVKRSRNRSICFGLMAWTLKPRSINVSTTGPCGTSIATRIWLGSAAPLAAMFEDFLADLAPVAVGQEHTVAQASPIDAGVPSSLIAHRHSPVQARAAAILADPCTGARGAVCASGANSPRGVDRGQSVGAQVPSRWSSHRMVWVAPDESARFREATPIRAVARQSRYVPLRVTSRHRRQALQEPCDEGTRMDAATRLVAGELAGADQRFRVFDFPKDEKRCARNRHLALQSAQGEYIAYLDDDDYWFPEHLETLRNALAEADFAHTRLLMLHPDSRLEAFQDSLEDPMTRERMLAEAYNFIGPTQAAHRLSTYRELPEGWSTPEDENFNDLSMWRKFLRKPETRFRSSRAITTLHLPSSGRKSWSLAERLRELKYWGALLDRQETRARINLLFGESPGRELSRLVTVHTNSLLVNTENGIATEPENANV